MTEAGECYTVRCQGERLEERLARREQIEAREAAERAAVTPRPAKGLDFRKYVAIHRGMSEGEFITIAGEPDLLLWDSGPVKTYTYFPTPGDPFTTTVVLRQRPRQRHRARAQVLTRCAENALARGLHSGSAGKETTWNARTRSKAKAATRGTKDYNKRTKKFVDSGKVAGRGERRRAEERSKKRARCRRPSASASSTSRMRTRRSAERSR